MVKFPASYVRECLRINNSKHKQKNQPNHETHFAACQSQSRPPERENWNTPIPSRQRSLIPLHQRPSHLLLRSISPYLLRNTGETGLWRNHHQQQKQHYQQKQQRATPQHLHVIHYIDINHVITNKKDLLRIHSTINKHREWMVDTIMVLYRVLPTIPNSFSNPLSSTNPLYTMGCTGQTHHAFTQQTKPRHWKKSPRIRDHWIGWLKSWFKLRDHLWVW